MNTTIIRTLLGLQVICGYFFIKSTGLLYFDNQIVYCNDLMSSGSDDSMVVQLTMYIYCFPLLLSFFFRKKVMIYAVTVSYMLQIASYFLIDVCSISDTILYGINISLALLLIIPMATILLLIKTKSPK